MEDENNRAFLWLSEDPKSLSKVRLRKILDKVIKSSPNGLKIDLADDSTPHILNLSHNKVAIDPIWYDLKKIFDNYNAIQHLKSSVVERQIFPSVAMGIETIYENKLEMPLLGGLKDF
jgi:hypothetical protein